MNFADLHERLRLELVRRIHAEDLTGSRLAQMTGFRQAHISNFLNRKRALSLEGLDRVLAAQNLTIPQILSTGSHSGPPGGVDLQAVAASGDEMRTVSVPLVPPSVLMDDAIIRPHIILEKIPVAASLLCEYRARCAPGRTRWDRFVAFRAEAQQAAAMEPILLNGSVLVLDRHYTSLALYRAQQPNLYAVRCSGSLQLGFAAFDDGRLILRPNSTAFPVQLIPVHGRESPSDLIVGRVCLVLNEL